MAKIAMVLEILGDGRWHQIEELMLSLKLSDDKFKELTSFLTAYSFANIDEKKRRVKINSDFKRLVTQIT